MKKTLFAKDCTPFLHVTDSNFKLGKMASIGYVPGVGVIILKSTGEIVSDCPGVRCFAVNSDLDVDATELDEISLDTNSFESYSDLRSNYPCNSFRKEMVVFVEADSSNYICEEDLTNKNVYEWVLEEKNIEKVFTYRIVWFDTHSANSCNSTDTVFSPRNNKLYICISKEWDILKNLFNSCEDFYANVPCSPHLTYIRGVSSWDVNCSEEQIRICAKSKSKGIWQWILRDEANYIDFDYQYACWDQYRDACFAEFEIFKNEVPLKGSVYASYDENTGVMTDLRDGKTYKTKKLANGAVWMAEDLMYTDSKIMSDSIKKSYKWNEAVDSISIANVAPGRYKLFCDTLYADYPVQGICPDGWHLPTMKEVENSFKIGVHTGNTRAEVEEIWLYSGDSLYSNSAGMTTWHGCYCLTNRATFNTSYIHRHRGLDEGEKRWEEKFLFDGLIKTNECAVRCIKDDSVGLSINPASPVTVSSSSQNQAVVKSSSSYLIKSDSSKTVCPSLEIDSNSLTEKGCFVDKRDAHAYRTVTIGSQTWMAENLNYETENSYCYNDDPNNCAKYGRLYTWAAAVGKSEKECGSGHLCELSGIVQGACPNDWHLPSGDELYELFTYIDNMMGDGVNWKPGRYLKSQNEWLGDYEKSSDEYGFSMLPAGYRGPMGYYTYEEQGAFFWSSTEANGYIACYTSLEFAQGGLEVESFDKSFGYSVRCIKD